MFRKIYFFLISSGIGINCSMSTGKFGTLDDEWMFRRYLESKRNSFNDSGSDDGNDSIYLYDEDRTGGLESEHKATVGTPSYLENHLRDASRVASALFATASDYFSVVLKNFEPTGTTSTAIPGPSTTSMTPNLGYRPRRRVVV